VANGEQKYSLAMGHRASTFIQTFKAKPLIVAVYSTSQSERLIAFSASRPAVAALIKTTEVSQDC
jgi:hypothetical protein